MSIGAKTKNEKFDHDVPKDVFMLRLQGATNHRSKLNSWDQPYPIKVVRNQSTVNSDWYFICLPEVFGEIKETNSWRLIIHHHDNASSYIGPRKRFLSSENIELIGHPLHCPDLAPSDLFYSRTSQIHVLEWPHSEWKKYCENWSKRMQKSIDIHWEYFE